MGKFKRFWSQQKQTATTCFRIQALRTLKFLYEEGNV